MTSNAKTVEQYIQELPAERKEPIRKLREVILSNLPDGFEETMQYGMISYVVPHSVYPAGYHTNPNDALPFISLASQKNNISFYHMGIYDDNGLLDWFTGEYAKRVKTKLDMGKACIRFKNMKTIPYDLIGELCRKITVKEHIERYESIYRRKK